MFELVGSTATTEATSDRAEELFQQHRRQIFRQTDQLFAKLMLFQWVACIIIALLVSPRTWSGGSSQIHIHVWSAILIGGAISLFPVWMTRAWPGTFATRNVIAVAQMLMSALLTALTGGRIETHFHVFGSLVILSFYRDWRVLVPATIVVYIDHFREAGVDLLKSLVVDGHYGHADRRVVKKLPRGLIAGLKSGGSVGNEAHFPDASETRNHQKNVLKYHPTSMFD